MTILGTVYQRHDVFLQADEKLTIFDPMMGMMRRSYVEVVVRYPNYARGWHKHGKELEQGALLEDSARAFCRAAYLDPDVAKYWAAIARSAPDTLPRVDTVGLVGHVTP